MRETSTHFFTGHLSPVYISGCGTTPCVNSFPLPQLFNVEQGEKDLESIFEIFGLHCCISVPIKTIVVSLPRVESQRSSYTVNARQQKGPKWSHLKNTASPPARIPPSPHAGKRQDASLSTIRARTAKLTCNHAKAKIEDDMQLVCV